MDAFPRGRGHSYISRMAIVRGMHPAERLRGVKSIKLQGKTIVLGVTGSIAAVECVKLAHELIRHGAEVHAVFTRSATEIIHPNALQYATGNPVVTQITGSMEYLEMCGRDGKADLLLIAPCTSNTISKIAQGIDDSTVTTYAANALGSGIPILVAPAAHESNSPGRLPTRGRTWGFGWGGTSRRARPGSRSRPLRRRQISCRWPRRRMRTSASSPPRSRISRPRKSSPARSLAAKAS